MTLRVINGGGGGGGRGGSPRAPVEPAPKPFKPHPLAVHLWNAIYPRGEKRLAVIAKKMTKTSGLSVSTATAFSVITHVRDNWSKYEWTVPPVQKGRSGDNRKYIVALVDPLDPSTVITEEQGDGRAVMVRSGAVSAATNILTECRHASIAFEIMANDPLLSPDEQRQMRAVAPMFSAAFEVIKQVAEKLKNRA